MRPTLATYALGLLVLLSLALMYMQAFVLGAYPVPMALTILVAIPTTIGAVHALRTSLALPRPRSVDIIVAVIGTGASLGLSRGLGVPALVASAFVGACLGLAVLSGGPLDALSAGAGYAGSVVGLLTPQVTLGWYWVLLAGAVTGLLWTLIGPSVIQGVGGRMGVVALMGSAGVYWLASLLGDEHETLLLPGVNGIAHWVVIPVGAVGALITWLLTTRLGWTFNLASGLPSLVVCGVLAMAGPRPYEVVLATAFFGGTFVGGTTTARLNTAFTLGMAGLLYGAYMLHFEAPLEGHVGVIGATGTIAVLAIMGCEVVWNVLRGRTASAHATAPPPAATASVRA